MSGAEKEIDEALDLDEYVAEIVDEARQLSAKASLAGVDASLVAAIVVRNAVDALAEAVENMPAQIVETLDKAVAPKRTPFPPASPPKR